MVHQNTHHYSLSKLFSSSNTLLRFLFHFSQMVQTLYSNGANSIWEHSLLDPASVMSGKRKANPQDKLQWVITVWEMIMSMFILSHWTEEGLSNIKHEYVLFTCYSYFCLTLCFFMLPQKPKQNRIHKGQISNASICPSHALPRGWQLDSQGFKQGEKK